MVKFHIRDNGELGVCEAKDACPLGGDTPHAEFANKKEAQGWVERINEAKAGGVFTRNEGLVKKWTFRSFVNYDAAKGDADAKAILEGKIAEATSDDEIRNVTTELRELASHRGNYNLAAEMVSKIENPAILEKLELSYNAHDPSVQPYLAALYKHPQATDAMRNYALSQRGMSYSDKIALTGPNPDFKDRIAIISSTNWGDEGKRHLRAMMDGALDELESDKVKEIDGYTAATLIRAEGLADSGLKPNTLLEKLNPQATMYDDQNAVMDYGFAQDFETLSNKSIRNLTAITHDSANPNAILAIRERLDNIGRLSPIKGYSENEVSALKKDYEQAIANAGGQIRSNFVGAENDAARIARDEYNKTRIPALRAELADIDARLNRVFASAKEKSELRSRYRNAQGLLNGARLAHAKEEIMRSVSTD